MDTHATAATASTDQATMESVLKAMEAFRAIKSEHVPPMTDHPELAALESLLPLWERAKDNVPGSGSFARLGAAARNIPLDRIVAWAKERVAENERLKGPVINETDTGSERPIDSSTGRQINPKHGRV